MRRHTVIGLASAIACIIGASIYLAPTHEEIALMKMEDNHFREALEHYTALQSQGDTSINVIAPLVKLRVHYGDMPGAIALVEAYLVQNPRSVEGHKWLADLYKSSQRLHHYCRELETVQTLAPAAANLRFLADTYDFLGNYKEEMQALARLVASPGYHPREDDYVRLAAFYRVNDQTDEAIHTVQAFINIKQDDVHIETLQLAAQLLLEKGNDRQALSLASGYLAKYRKEKDAITLAALFRDRGYLDSAYALLTPFLPNVSNSPELLQQLVTLQLAQGKQKEAYRLLSMQFVKDTLPESLMVTLMDLAPQYNDYALWEGLIQTAPLEDFPREALLRYADMALQSKRPDLARTMQNRLGRDYLRDAPALAAVLNFAASGTPKAMAALLNLPREAMLLAEQKMIVANIYFRYGYSRRALALFEGMPVADLFSAFDATEFARLYLDTGEGEKAIQLLSAARPTSLPAMQARIDRALLLLAAGQGKSEIVGQWLKDHPNNDNSLFDDAYDLAQRQRYPEIALIFAQRLYQGDPTVGNRIQLTEALIMNHRYAEAIKNVQPITEQAPAARTIYIEAMTDWIRQAGKNAPGPNREMLDAFIASAIKHAGMSGEERRNLAYLLQETGFTDKAEDIFVDLASNQPFGTPEVTELLDFWGDRLSPGALGWMESRARVAHGAEKAAWLHHLNDTGHPQSVLAIGDGVQESTPVIDEYIDALAAVHDNQHLSGVLTQEIAAESHPARLRHLATIAGEENLSGLSEKGWRRLHKIVPDDSEAAKELGLLAFDAHHYGEAKPLLEQYLDDKTSDDYRVDSAYAEILQHLQKKEEASAYFARAEKQVSEIKEKDVTALLDQAYLLYRNNHLEQSLDLYRSLLAQYPQNKTVRADFAEMLIDTKRFDEASLVLQ